MNIKAIIFDLDGTLLDTLADLANSMNAVLKQMNLPTHPIEAYRLFVGDGVRTLAARSLAHAARNELLVDECVTRMREEYTQQCLFTTRPYKGIEELLKKLIDLRISLCVLSNKPDIMTNHLVKTIFSTIPFARIVGAKEGIPHKPAPTALLAILNELGIDKQNCIYVGDSAVDMETAKRAGVFSVGVAWGFRGKEELEKAGAHVIIDSPMELLGIIAQ